MFQFEHFDESFAIQYKEEQGVEWQAGKVWRKIESSHLDLVHLISQRDIKEAILDRYLNMGSGVENRSLDLGVFGSRQINGDIQIYGN